jgi:hypothetical protein
MQFRCGSAVSCGAENQVILPTKLLLHLTVSLGQAARAGRKIQACLCSAKRLMDGHFSEEAHWNKLRAIIPRRPSASLQRKNTPSSSSICKRNDHNKADRGRFFSINFRLFTNLGSNLGRPSFPVCLSGPRFRAIQGSPDEALSCVIVHSLSTHDGMWAVAYCSIVLEYPYGKIAAHSRDARQHCSQSLLIHTHTHTHTHSHTEVSLIWLTHAGRLLLESVIFILYSFREKTFSYNLRRNRLTFLLCSFASLLVEFQKEKKRKRWRQVLFLIVLWRSFLFLQ